MGKTYDRLDIDERYEICRLREAGASLREIGRMMGRSVSTISRELARNGQAAIVAKRLLTKIAVRLAAHIQGIMPGDVEGQGLHRLPIRQVVQLLQQQDPDDDLKVLARSAMVIIKMTAELVNAKM